MDHLIRAYIEGIASEKEMQSLLQWISTNEENKKYFFNQLNIWIASGSVLSQKSQDKRDEAFLTFKENVLSYEKTQMHKQFIYKCLKVAASVAIVIISITGAYYGGIQHEKKKSPDSEAFHYKTLIRSNKDSVRLSDGSLVWLNNNSSLSYPEQFGEGKKRIVKLEGEGYFEVAYNEQAPFYVETENLTIKVLGTKFNANCYSNKGISEVVLLSGKVEAILKNNNEHIALSPNQKITFDNQSETYKLENVAASAYMVWKNDRLIMNNESLEVIFGKMERWYGITIECKGNIPLLSKYSITITDESKEEILKLLSILTPISYKIEKNKIIITSSSK